MGGCFSGHTNDDFYQQYNFQSRLVPTNYNGYQLQAMQYSRRSNLMTENFYSHPSYQPALNHYRLAGDPAFYSTRSRPVAVPPDQCVHYVSPAQHRPISQCVLPTPRKEDKEEWRGSVVRRKEDEEEEVRKVNKREGEEEERRGEKREVVLQPVPPAQGSSHHEMRPTPIGTVRILKPAESPVCLFVRLD